MIGYQDLLILLGIGVFLFGAKKLPELARSLGQSMKEFKKGVAGAADEPDSPTPAPPPTASPIPPRTCTACQSPLQPDWAHCPRCGASVPRSALPMPPT